MKYLCSRNRNRIAGAALLAASIFFCSARSEGQSLALAPAEVRVTFKPGQPFQFDVGVSNDGANPVVMKTSVMDLWYNQKNEKVFGRAGSLPHSASNWIEFVPRNFAVAAHGSGKVRVVVTPPMNVAGGYYAVLFVESKPQLAQAASAGKQAVYTNIRLGALILLTAENTEKEEIEISDVRFSPPAANENLKLDFMLANKGNTHIFPQGKLVVLNSRKQLVARAEAEPKRFLPGQKDSLNVGWAGTIPGGSYIAILTVVYGKDKIHTQEFPFTVAGN